MRSILFASLSILLAQPAFGQGSYEPDPLESAPEGDVDCSWSSMKKEEYQECLRKKQFFSKMKPEEKEAYNEVVKERQLEERVRRLERRVDFLEKQTALNSTKEVELRGAKGKPVARWGRSE